MSNLLDCLRQERDTYAVKLQKLLIHYNKNPSRLFIAFEGQDDKYYCVRIKEALNGCDYDQIPCNGKRDVIKLRERVGSDNNLYGVKILYFIDRDFDDNSELEGVDEVYLTPCYSIENLYVQEAVIKQIMINEFSLDAFNYPEELDRIVTLYTHMLSQFINIMRPLNAWIVAQRQIEDIGGRINLNGKKLNRFAKIELGNVSSNYCIAELSTIFQEAPKVEAADLYRILKQLSDVDGVVKFRGKYFIEFLRVFLDLLKKDKASATPEWFPTKGSVKLSLSKDNIISELSQYAITPPCFRNFMAANAAKWQATA